MRKLLAQSNAVDFDDLLLRSARLLRENAEVRERWQRRFTYIHVDEYQDTNRVQYELLRLLTGPHQNLCVVGDEDQSIYRWRGADVSILLSFSRDFPHARVVKLERNYRSTQNILDAAGAVVANNPERLGKVLSAENGVGSNVKYFEARDAQAEAEFVAGELEKIQNDDPDLTCAVEYRTNFQSRAFEEVFRRRGLRYKLVGGFSFYERAEVKDTLAYVRLAIHPEDDIALLRVLNVPPRGIGKTTVDAVRDLARANSTSLWNAIEKFVSGAVAGRAITPLRAFQELIGKLREAQATQEPPDFLRTVLDETGYMAMLKDRNSPEDVARLENLEELTRAVAESIDAGESFTDFPRRRSAGQRYRFLRGQTRRHADYLAQHQRSRIRSRFPDRHGRRHLPAQSRHQRRKRHRGRTPPRLRGHDARAQIAHANARRLSPYFRQRTTNAARLAVALSGRDS
jgi:DNA helicase II / ATP-dependent DNA helicase PcrA